MHSSFLNMAATKRSSAVLFRFKGIQVRLHWSFPLLIIWVVFSAYAAGLHLPDVLKQVAYVLIVFTCVVLHEFGHALTALRFGVRTRDILLLPIGGVASLERIPERPRQEFLITIAGPLVNLAIVLLIALPLLLFDKGELLFLPHGPLAGIQGALAFTIMANLGLFLFNLVPAFPMDGGRILRSLLAMRMDRVRATRIAVMIGRIFAVGFIVASFRWQQPMLGLIGLFVYLGAGAEMNAVKMQGALAGMRVKDVMRTRFWTMAHDATAQEAADELLAGGDHVVVVTRNGRFLKLVQRTAIIGAVQQHRSGQTLEQLEGQEPEAVATDLDARIAYERLTAGRSPLLPVADGDRLVGVVELDNLNEYQELHSPEHRPA